MGTPDPRLGFLCASSEGDDGGIVTYRRDDDTGELTETAREPVPSASFLTLGPAGEYLYSVNRIGGGSVIAYEIVGSDGELAEINRQSSEGAGPAYVSIDGRGEYVFVANYAGGTVAMYPVRDDGGLEAACDVVEHEGSSVDPDRQEEPHPHSIDPGPDDRFVYAPDLGTDEVASYRIDRDVGAFEPIDPAVLHDGAGPRHLDFHPDRRGCYVINELDSTITTYERDGETGVLTEIDTISTLPAGYDEESYCADVHVHPTGRWVYGSNRGHDSIAIFAVDEDDGSLSLIETESTQGHWPRNFALDPAGRFLYAENRRSDSIVTFAIDQDDGTLTATGATYEETAPICLAFLGGRIT